MVCLRGEYGGSGFAVQFTGRLFTAQADTDSSHEPTNLFAKAVTLALRGFNPPYTTCNRAVILWLRLAATSPQSWASLGIALNGF